MKGDDLFVRIGEARALVSTMPMLARELVDHMAEMSNALLDEILAEHARRVAAETELRELRAAVKARDAAQATADFERGVRAAAAQIVLGGTVIEQQRRILALCEKGEAE